MKNKILIVAAHPDDEALGAGGTILKHAAAGDEIKILLLGDGETSRQTADISKRAEQAKACGKLLGASEVILHQLPDQRFDTVPLLDIIQLIEPVVLEWRPTIVYTHCPYDLNADHRLTFQATLTACRPGPNLSVQKLLAFETLSSTEWQIKDQANNFSPNYYSDITDFLKKKIEAVLIYKDEIREFPHPRSAQGIEILAQYRGMEVGYQYAEAFQVIRILTDPHGKK